MDGNPYDLRLVGGANEWEGRVEVSVNNEWGSVCSFGVSTNDVIVMCRQLGYHRPLGQYINGLLEYLILHNTHTHTHTHTHTQMCTSVLFLLLEKVRGSNGLTVFSVPGPRTTFLTAPVVGALVKLRKDVHMTLTSQ